MPTVSQARLIREWGQNYPGLPTPDFEFSARYWSAALPWEPGIYPIGIGSNIDVAAHNLEYPARTMRTQSAIRCPECRAQSMVRDPFADGTHAWLCEYCSRYWTDGEVREDRRLNSFTVNSLMTQIGLTDQPVYAWQAQAVRHKAAQKLQEVMQLWAEQEGRPLPDESVFLTVEIIAHYIEDGTFRQTSRICQDILSVFVNRAFGHDEAIARYARIAAGFRETLTPQIPEEDLVAE